MVAEYLCAPLQSGSGLIKFVLLGIIFDGTRPWSDVEAETRAKLGLSTPTPHPENSPAATVASCRSLYFYIYGNIEIARCRHGADDQEQVVRFADMLSAMGTEPSSGSSGCCSAAHPVGMVVGDIGDELAIPNSTLSHHLDKLKNEGSSA